MISWSGSGTLPVVQIRSQYALAMPRRPSLLWRPRCGRLAGSGPLADETPFQNDTWVAGGDDASVRQYSDDKDEMIALVTQTGGMSVRCLAYSPKGDKLVIGSE